MTCCCFCWCVAHVVVQVVQCQLMSVTVLRVIPDQSLAEDALQDAVERLEEHIGHMMELMEVPVALVVPAVVRVVLPVAA